MKEFLTDYLQMIRESTGKTYIMNERDEDRIIGRIMNCDHIWELLDNEMEKELDEYALPDEPDYEVDREEI